MNQKLSELRARCKARCGPCGLTEQGTQHCIQCALDEIERLTKALEQACECGPVGIYWDGDEWFIGGGIPNGGPRPYRLMTDIAKRPELFAFLKAKRDAYNASVESKVPRP